MNNKNNAKHIAFGTLSFKVEFHNWRGHRKWTLSRVIMFLAPWMGFLSFSILIFFLWQILLGPDKVEIAAANAVAIFNPEQNTGTPGDMVPGIFILATTFGLGGLGGALSA